MAGRKKLHLYLTTVTLIVILLTESQEAHFASLCAHTAYPTLCEPLVKGPSPRRATHSTIRALETKTKTAMADASRFKHGNPAISICYATLMDASFNLGLARKSLRRRDVLSLQMYLTAAVSDYGVCGNAFIESGQINVVQNAVNELRKMGTNCLWLATLIR